MSTNPCDEFWARIAFYLDDELNDEEKLTLEAHLGDCPACREAFEHEQRWIQIVRAARPLYRAPTSLQTRVQRMFEQEQAALAGRSHAGKSRRILTVGRYLGLSLGLATFVLGGLLAVRVIITKQASSEFAQLAVESHLRYLDGRLPLELKTTSPGTVSAWFQGKVPFELTLPNYQESSSQEPLYRLEGARLVGFYGDYAALVVYRMGQQPISLLVTSSALTTPSGGETLALRGLIFHSETIAGFKVISWSDRGLTYALVSKLAERGQQSCLVCHQGSQDRELIEQLRP